MSLQPAYILMTMDCESARVDVSDHGHRMSSSGPAVYTESARSITGYVESLRSAGYPATLFLHPEVAVAHADLVRGMRSSGACLGLHLHPYKMTGSAWQHDLGAYAEPEQRAILEQAVERWEDAIGERPLYFRAGYFSANDATFRILTDLGFRGGSLSCPGRILPSHFSVWRDADPYPHRAHRAFRLVRGTCDFIEVPVAVAYGRPVTQGHAGEAGYEWPYIPHTYDHAAGVREIFDRFRSDEPQFPTYVTDTHNDHDYSDPDSPASGNLRTILDAIRATCDATGFAPVPTTLDTLCDEVRASL